MFIIFSYLWDRQYKEDGCRAILVPHAKKSDRNRNCTSLVFETVLLVPKQCAIVCIC